MSTEINQSFGDNEAFLLAVQRLKEEHAELEAKVNDLNIKAEQVHDNRDIPFALNLLQHLLADVQGLMTELEAHEAWEEQHIYPIASDYFKLQIRPSITPSLWVLEKEHALVKHCFQPFMDLAKITTVSIGDHDDKMSGQLNLCAAYLLQGCSVLREHIELEAGLIYPLVDEILTDIDYLLS